MAATENERLIAWLKKKRGEMSYAQFAQLSGVSKSTLQRFEAGEGELSLASKALLAKAFSDFPSWAVDRDVLVRYESQIEPKTHKVEEPRAPYYSGYVSRELEFVDLPFHDITAAAGAGKINEGAPAKTYLAFRRDWVMWRFGSTSGLSLIRAEGDSMVKSFPDGATLMIRRRQSANIGKGVYLLRLGDELCVKRLTETELKGEDDGRVVLSALVVSDTDDQKTHPPKRIVFGFDESAQNTVLARVVWAAVEID